MVDVYHEIVPNLVMDDEAQQKSIDELRGIPHFQLEELLLQHKLDLTIDGIVLGGIGDDGVGFKLGDKDGERSYLKIFRLGLVPQPILIDFVQKSGVHRENITNWDGSKVSEAEFQKTLKEWTDSLFDDSEADRKSAASRKLFERQALGIKKGHELLPNRVPELQAIWTWNGEPVAIATEFKEGKGEPITKWNEDYSADVKILETNGIIVDDFFERDNAIRDKDNNVWFIDLEYWPENKTI